jgi:hypothetical protein
MASSDWQHPFTSMLDQDFKLWCAGTDAPSEADVAGLETRLGVKLPEQYRRFLERYGGIMLEVLESAWPRPKEFDVGPFWSFQYAFLVFGMGKDIPDWLNIETVTAELHQNFPQSEPLVPFFRQIATAKFYLCFDQQGRIVDWSCEEPDEHRLLDESFDEVLVRETRELVENKQKIKNREDAIGKGGPP